MSKKTIALKSKALGMGDDGEKGTFRSASSFKFAGSKVNNNNESLVAGYDQDIETSDFAKRSETIRRLAGIQDTPFSRQSTREHFEIAIEKCSTHGR